MHRRPVVPAALALTLLAGCGGSTEPAAEAAEGSTTGAFPVTVEHTFGSTTVEEEPERVVVLGWNAQDVVYALGETPVGMPKVTYGATPAGTTA